MGEAAGLIFGVRADDDGHTHEVTWADVERPQMGTGFLWLHFDAESETTARWVREKSGINPISQDAVLAEETRPRTAVHEGALLLILRAVNLNPGTEPDDMISLRVYVEEHRLLTFRRRPVRTVEAVRDALRAGWVEPSAGELLVAICDQLTKYVGEVIEDVDEKADGLEEEVLTAESRGLRAKISDLRRTMIALRRYVAPQREAIARAAEQRLPWLDGRHQGRLREIADRCMRHLEELDAARDRAGVANEELSGRLTERVERRMYVLSLVAAIFLPIGFVTGLLGINVGGIPATDNPRAFVYVLGGCVAAALLMVVWMKRRGWI